MEGKKYDNAIEKEILLAEERELQLKKERGMLVNSQDFQEMTEVDRHTHVHKDDMNEKQSKDEQLHEEDIEEDEVNNSIYEKKEVNGNFEKRNSSVSKNIA